MSESERHPDGQISVEQRGRILLMGLDRREKYNGLTPKMMRELGLAYTRLDRIPSSGSACCSATASISPRGSTSRSGRRE
jgi:hypothetical protein